MRKPVRDAEMNPPQPPIADLEEQFFETSRARWRRWFPWLHLLGVFPLAINSRRMLVAFLAVCLWGAGEKFLEPDGSGERELTGVLSELGLPRRYSNNAYVHDSYVSVKFGGVDVSWLAPYFPGLLAMPVNPRLEPSGGPRTDGSRFLVHLMNLLLAQGTWGEWLRSCLIVGWGLAVCSLLGGAISRMTAVEFAGKTTGKLVPALRFSARRLLSSLGAPLASLVLLGIFWGLNALGGFIARIPWAGDGLVSAFFIVPLVLGFLIALLVIGVVAGWPLMVAAVQVESTDAFDALSRAYSYVFNRPWYTLFLAALTAVQGMFLLWVVTCVVQMSVHYTAASLRTGLGESASSALFSQAPSGPIQLPDGSFLRSDSPTSSLAKDLVGLWMGAVARLPSAFLFSYFWSVSTMGYFLLRLSEDGTPLDEVDLSDVQLRERPSLPLAGIPAANLREKSLGIVRGETGPGESPPPSPAGE